MTDEQDRAAVRALDVVRPAGEPQTIVTAVDKPDNAPYTPKHYGELAASSGWRPEATHVVVETKPRSLGPLAGAVFVPGQQQASQCPQQFGQQQAASNATVYGIDFARPGSDRTVDCIAAAEASKSIQDRPFMALAVRALDAPVPGEIYCLADLPFGELVPTIELRRQMSSALYEHASSQRLKGNFTERAGTQYRIATDTLQYYIVRCYGDEVKI